MINTFKKEILLGPLGNWLNSGRKCRIGECIECFHCNFVNVSAKMRIPDVFTHNRRRFFHEFLVNSTLYT
jgi:hypothetical protein